MATQQQIKAAVAISQQLQAQAAAFAEFCKRVDGLASVNWTFSQNIGGIQVQTVVDAQSQADLSAQYTTLKANLAALFGTLP